VAGVRNVWYTGRFGPCRLDALAVESRRSTNGVVGSWMVPWLSWAQFCVRPAGLVLASASDLVWRCTAVTSTRATGIPGDGERGLVTCSGACVGQFQYRKSRRGADKRIDAGG